MPMNTSPPLRFGRHEVRPAERRLLTDGLGVSLGARAFDMLLALLERRDRVVGRDELFGLIWPGLVVEDNNLRQQVSALRKVLGAEAVATVPGRGYRFALPVDGDGARADMPAATKAAPLRGNLPMNLASLIGREDELAAVVELLAATPLLTVVGAGGVGKTRFAQEIAGRTVGDHDEGAWFVDLAPVTEAARVPAAVADVLGVRAEPARTLLDTLLGFLRDRRLLLVLDNCEHLVDACARFADSVLRRCAGVRLLATSREPLGIGGETVWRMPSLRTAVIGAADSPEQLMRYAAIELFVQRAKTASPAFVLSHGNAAAVVRICHDLDGIPLALELAAARIQGMHVEQVAERLRDRFHLLARGSRTALQRHQTLRSLIDWSHELLSAPERALLRRLAVFAGGWTLEAAEAVGAGHGLVGEDVLEVLSHLVEKSLVQLDTRSARPRYRMLETLRQYGLDKLAEAGEADVVRTAHLAYFANLAATMRPHFNGTDQLAWYARADADLDNFRSAIGWSLWPDRADIGFAIVHALHKYWYQRMYWKEGVAWNERLAAALGSDAAPTRRQAQSLYVSAMLIGNFDIAASLRLSRECLAMSRALDYAEGISWACGWIGYIESRSRLPQTKQLFIDSLRLARTITDPHGARMAIVNSLICYAGYESLMGRYADAEALLHECETETRAMGGDPLYVGHCRALLGNMAVRQGDLDRANGLLAESLLLYGEIDSPFDVAGILSQQGFLALRRGDAAAALDLFMQSLPHHRDYPASPWAAKGLAHLVIANSACARWDVAVKLAAALDARDDAAMVPLRAPGEVAGQVASEYDQAVDRAREALDGASFRDACQAGSALTMAQAIELALRQT
ncbi:MAG: winged helix-turn-helix domain-containing protein [Caldimonas sp.]